MSRFRVIKKDGDTKKYLRHEGHNHFWTLKKEEAMEYTKIEVAQGLADKNKAQVEAA